MKNNLLVFLITLICSCSDMIAQSWKEYDSLCNVYIEKHIYDTALVYAEKAMAFAKDEIGDKSYEYAVSLNKNAELLVTMSKYDAAEPLYLKGINILSSLKGVDKKDYILTLGNLGILYMYMALYEKADSLLIMAVKLCDEYFGKKSIEYAGSLNNLAELYRKVGKYEEAEPLYIKASELDSLILGANSTEFATDIDNLASLYYSKSDYKKAEELFIKALNIRKEKLGVTHPLYGISVNNLGVLYFTLNLFQKAEPFFEEAAEIIKKTLGEESKDYASALNNLAMVYTSLCDYNKAISVQNKAAEINSLIFSENHPNCGMDFNYLATTYRLMGQYSKAEPLCYKALDIFESNYGKKHSLYIAALINLGGLYLNMGRYDKALKINADALDVIKETFNEKESLYSIALNDRSLIFEKTGQYEEAEKILLHLLEIDKGIYGGNSANYAVTLNNLACIYRRMGKFSDADTIHLKSLEIIKQTRGEKNFSYSTYLNNLGNVYRDLKQYEKAEQSLKQSLNIKQELLNKDHPSMATSYNNLGCLLLRMNRYNDAEYYFLNLLENIYAQIDNTFDYMSEQSRNEFYQSLSFHVDVIMSYVFESAENKISLKISPYNVTLTQKGIVLKSMLDFTGAITASNDTVLTDKFNTFVNLKQHLAFLKAQSLSKQKSMASYINDLEEKTDSLEKELMSQSKEYRDVKTIGMTNWLDIQKKLNINEAAIELFRFRYYNKAKISDSIFYCALLVRPGYTHPEMKFLFEQKQLDSLLSQAYANDHQFVEQIYAGNQKENKLYSLIWKPIDTLLQGVKTVYFSPSGLLHKISFAAIPTPDGKYLSDNYNLMQLGSTREIIKLKEKNDYITQSDNALIYGGVNYNKMDTLPDTLQTNALLSEVRSVAVPADSTQKNYPMNYLKETLAEAEFIDKLFELNKISSLFYSGSQATETSFKYTSGKSPQVIHIATHGYFYPDIKKKKEELELLGQEKQFYRFSENPLLRSGLMFAGANKVWTGGEAEEGRDDGILTAYEVSNMNLSNTKLVVLSACQTGLGDIKGSEGVFGLQRAFKMAGVKYIIASLWQVPGKETNEFMQLFYAHCFKNQSIREAFNNAQAKMRNKYSPYYWGAFVLME